MIEINKGTLLEQLEQLEQRLKEAERKYDEILNQFGEERSDYNKCLLQLREAEKVIEFYADENNWSYQQIIDDVSDIKGSLEAGKHARQYLEKYVTTSTQKE